MKKTNSTFTNLIQKAKTYMTKRNLIISGSIIAVILLYICVKIVINAVHPPVIAFYGIEQSAQQKLQAELKEILDSEGASYSFVTYNSGDTMERQLNKGVKPSVVFTVAGAPVQAAVKKASDKAALNQEVLSDMTSSMRGASILTKDGKKVKALPVLLDNLEIDIDLPAFHNSGMKEITGWKHIETYNQIQQTKNIDHPMIFAGKDSDFLLDLLGALTEALDDRTQYAKAAEILQQAAEHKFDAVKTAELLAGSYNAPLYSSVSYITKLFQNKTLHPDVFAFTQTDVSAFLKAKLATTAIMTLSDHRSTATKTIGRFTSIYFPSTNSPAIRSFTAQTIYAVPVKKNAPLNKMLISLTTDTYQEKISRSTGLAPTNAHSRVPDKQADDVRYWVAATNTPLAGLSHEADLTRKQKDALAAELISKIRN